MRGLLTVLGVGGALLVAAGDAAQAQTFNSGSTGADGAFTPASNVTLTVPPSGIFHFTTVTIPAGVTVTFARNAANTPVILLASGDVTIAGTLDLIGAPGGAGAFATLLAPNGGLGGPGGFAGGAGASGIVSTTAGTGVGPGGGIGGTAANAGGGGGGFQTAGAAGAGGTAGGGGTTYGTAALLPIVGGSGGGGGGAAFGNTGWGGGGGGGALVIASSGTLTFSGTILARGGAGGSFGFNTFGPGASGGGSGGAVRLVATTLAGSGGTIDVRGGAGGPGTGFSAGGAGGVGRVRLEAFTTTVSVNFQGVTPSQGLPNSAVLPNAPILRIASIAGVPAPAAPTGSLASPDVTLPAGTPNPVSVVLEGANIPPGTTVTVRVQGQVGSVSSTTVTLTGTAAATTAPASLVIPTDQPSVLTASASFILLAGVGGGPVFVQGEAVERVRVTAGWGAASQVAYITKSGREIVLGAGR